jgi:hypothetical protein
MTFSLSRFAESGLFVLMGVIPRPSGRSWGIKPRMQFYRRTKIPVPLGRGSSLIKELSKHIDIPEEINEVATLTDYAVQTRYPGDYTPVEKEEYENAVKVASDCINWIDKRTKQASYKIAQKERNQPYLGDL